MHFLLLCFYALLCFCIGISVGIRWSERRQSAKMVPCRYFCKSYTDPFYCPIGNKSCPDEPCMIAVQEMNKAVEET